MIKGMDVPLLIPPPPKKNVRQWTTKLSLRPRSAQVDRHIEGGGYFSTIVFVQNVQFSNNSFKSRSLENGNYY